MVAYNTQNTELRRGIDAQEGFFLLDRIQIFHCNKLY